MALTDCSVPSVDSFPTSVMTSIDGAVTSQFRCPAEVAEMPGMCDLLEQTFAAGAAGGFQAGAGMGTAMLTTKDPQTGQSLRSGAAGLADGATQLSGGIDTLVEELPKQTEQQLGLLAGGLTQLRDGAATLEEKAKPLVDAAPALGDGATQLLDGITQLDGQVGALPDGVTQLADGAKEASQGINQLSAGMKLLADNGSKLVDGGTQLVDGGGKLVDGGNQLVDGIGQLVVVESGSQHVTVLGEVPPQALVRIADGVEMRKR